MSYQVFLRTWFFTYANKNDCMHFGKKTDRRTFNTEDEARSFCQENNKDRKRIEKKNGDWKSTKYEYTSI